VIHGGSAGDTIDAGDGDDEVYGDSGPDVIRAGAGDDTVYVNNGTAVQSVDCGPGTDTIYINPAIADGGWSNAESLREGQIRGCEAVVEADPVTDPAKGDIPRAGHGRGRAGHRPR
jgi:Ca2+-binding RTX toxin-like protein